MVDRYEQFKEWVTSRNEIPYNKLDEWQWEYIFDAFEGYLESKYDDDGIIDIFRKHLDMVSIERKDGITNIDIYDYTKTCIFELMKEGYLR